MPKQTTVPVLIVAQGKGQYKGFLMNEFLDKALEKLADEFKSGKYDKYAEIMKKSVRETIEDFCRQDEEFAQAVVQGGSFEKCMETVAKNCGTGISDLEAYRRAVQFYFPGAEIRMQMTIDLIGAAAQEQTMGPMILDFTQFL